MRQGKFFKFIPSIFFIVALGKTPAIAQTPYPFSHLPDTLNAIYNVSPDQLEPVNNLLLGYNIFNFINDADKDFIRTFDPITIRFHHGVWANFYDWDTDGFSLHGDPYEVGSHYEVVRQWERSNRKGGIDGIEVLNEEKKIQDDGEGYDMMWTYNLNYHDEQSNVNRMRSDLSRGLEVEDIEMGNEHFWRSQRSTRTATPELYFMHAKALSNALKRENPELKLSIPLSWRRDHKDYNTILTADTSYFDAISYHKYVGLDPDIPGESNNAFSAILTGRLAMENDQKFVQGFAPGKPLWMTEWGVSGGDESIAAAALGMADCYLYLLENQEVYHRANWFSVNGRLNSFINISDNRVIKYPLEWSYYGVVHHIIREVFENAEMIEGSMDTHQLTTDLGSINAVSARMVIKEEMASIFAVNLTNKPVNFQLQFYSHAYEEGFVHYAYTFEDLANMGYVIIDEDPLQKINNEKQKIVLPPLSVNVLSSIEVNYNARPLSVDETNFHIKVYPNPSKKGVFDIKVSTTVAGRYSVYSASGVEIQKGKLSSSTSIDLQGNPAGIYYLKIASDKGDFQEELMIR
ncbi:MAG: T9SS type A sorting domain-containing protein [Bacteroidota bacterium]